MHPLSDFVAAERSLRDLLHAQDLPQPDLVQYEEASVVFLWNESRTAVIVDLDDEEEAV